MTSNKLEWQSLQPGINNLELPGEQSSPNPDDALKSVQPRLFDALQKLHISCRQFPILLVRSPGVHRYLSLIADMATQFQPETTAVYGGKYLFSGQQVSLLDAESKQDNFASAGEIHIAEWIEPEQLFGTAHYSDQNIQLKPGLIHQANGGTLVLSLRTLLAQPLMWLRLKNSLSTQRIEWLSADSRNPLPVSVPPLPLTLKLILCGDREELADFQEAEPQLSAISFYSEFEDVLSVAGSHSIKTWCQWVTSLTAKQFNLPAPDDNFWPVMIREAIRYSGDQSSLPTSPLWIERQINEARLHSQSERLNAECLQSALQAREWRESYLAERIYDDILRHQTLIETEGERVGQVNALSVLEFSGHPRPFGEPCRISCVVHHGDGEFVDVERKVELGGDIHAKGMMIMQAFLTSALKYEQQLPFTASIVFEQSYDEVDGDSASLAELCALISALSSKPVVQHIAVTGAIDQFGNVLSVGGINEKIEGFFYICQQRGLTGHQGVILPASNTCHLCLPQHIVDAVRDGKFHLWAVSRAEEAASLLTATVWEDESDVCLMSKIQSYITLAGQAENGGRCGLLSWLNRLIRG